MIKRPISRVMLTGAVGVVLVICLGGCSDFCMTSSCEEEKVAQNRQRFGTWNNDAWRAERRAAETAVEAYTEEPRWEGATDYSQSCSSSSGDLNC